MAPQEPGSAFSVTSRATEDCIVIDLSGELDTASAPAAWNTFQQAVRDTSLPVELHMSELAFMDSTGVSVLLRARQQLEEQGGQLVLVNPSPPSRRLIEVAGLDQVFSIRFTDEPDDSEAPPTN